MLWVLKPHNVSQYQVVFIELMAMCMSSENIKILGAIYAFPRPVL